MKSERQVVVTGIGLVAPNGIGRVPFWRSLLAAESGIGPITLFDASDLACRIAGEVHDFVPAEHVHVEKPHRLARQTQFGLCAAEEAIEDAGLDATYLKTLIGIPVILGVSSNAMELAAKPASPLTTVTGIPHAVASAIAYGHELDAPLLTVSDGCASSLDAVAAAAAMIRQGKADIAIAGGSDSSMSRFIFESFTRSRKVSTRNEEPARASRPFDRDRDGGLVAEGAGIMILESREHALARRAHTYARIEGYANFADRPGSREGEGLGRTMHMALANACLGAGLIDAVFAHAPSDSHMDAIETEMIKQALGPHAFRIPVTSIKGVTGNPLGAGGVMQLAAACFSMKHGVVPPTANYEHPDPLCDLDYPAAPRAARLRHAMINTHGFGRGNATLIAGRDEETDPA